MLVGFGATRVESQDLDCADFASQQDAQVVFDADPSDPNDLDADNDGVPCGYVSSGGALYDLGEGADIPAVDQSAAVTQIGNEVIIYAIDEAGTLIPGACFVISALTDLPVGSASLCDNDPARNSPLAVGPYDEDDAAGITTLGTGSFAITVTITTIPPGYELAPETSVAYTFGSERPVEITFVLSPIGANPVPPSADDVVAPTVAAPAPTAPLDTAQEREGRPVAIYVGSCDDLGRVETE